MQMVPPGWARRRRAGSALRRALGAALLLGPGLAVEAVDAVRDASALLQTSAGHADDRPESPEEALDFLFGETETTTVSHWRQELENFADMQYTANITVGGQAISGIIDTGSFELVVFEANCSGCGRSAKYVAADSPMHSKGTLRRGLFYGSGDVYAQEAFDSVTVGPLPAVNQSFWEVYQATMAVLQTARFQAIIGIGPAQRPRAEAWEQMQSAVEDIKETVLRGYRPRKWQEERVRTRLDFYQEVSRTPTMVDTFHISRFSMCLMNEPGARGYFVWNDTSTVDQPALFRRLKVMGRHTWTVNMTGVHLGAGPAGFGPVPVGCSEGCGAILDSGTSLLMMPSESVRGLQAILQRGAGEAFNCTNLGDLPDLVFRLDGELFSLPPDAYLAEVSDVPDNLAGLMRVRTLDVGDMGRCKLSVMESYSSTHWGPLWVLGMPFFRKYYTTFELGRSRAERSLSVAPASAECHPEAENAASLARFRHRTVYRRRVSMKDVLLSPTAMKAMQPDTLLDL